jgi:hypothetical protein
MRYCIILKRPQDDVPKDIGTMTATPKRKLSFSIAMMASMNIQTVILKKPK